MATPVSSIPTSLCSSSSFRNPNPQIHIQSSCSFSWVRTLKFSLFSYSSQLGHCHLSSWSGLRHLGASISLRDRRMGRKGRCKGKVLFASLFGVGAPEALVIGVVALLVFGPKGLAEVARNLGKTLRSFQPTIRELQEVSREFKDSLEREIGLDDVRSSSKNMYGSSRANFTSDPSSSVTEDSQGVADPNGAPANRAYSTEEYLKITQEQLKASAAAEPGSTSSSEEGQIEPKTEPQVAVEETATVIPPQNPEHDTT